MPYGVYLKLVGVAALWGGTFIAGRWIAAVVPHFTLAAMRFWLAFVVLAPLLWWQQRGWPSFRPRDWVFACGLALSGLVLYNLFFFGALERISASRTALVVALNPVLTALLLALVLRQSVEPHRWLGIVTALLGVCIVLSKGDLFAITSRMTFGEWLMIGGALCWAIYSVIGRAAFGGQAAPSSLALTTLTTFCGAVMLSLGVPFEWSDWRLAELGWDVWVSIFYLGAGGTALAFVWYSDGLRTIGPARTTVFNNLVPVFGVIFGSLILREPVLTSMWIGGLVALLGISLTNWSRR
jgi:drug/metabolite transporter (DMT)-like permease